MMHFLQHKTNLMYKMRHFYGFFSTIKCYLKLNLGTFLEYMRSRNKGLAHIIFELVNEY